MKPHASRQGYVPALGFHWLTRFYDPLLKALREEKMKRALIRQAAIEPGHRVLDLGCGTGTLAIMIKQACPEASVAGLDGDPEVLATAREKAEKAGVEIEFREGMAFEPSFPARSFDRVLSSLVFHHLTTENKRRTLARMRECLKPGGELHVADWGRADGALMRIAFLGVQLLDGFATTSDNVRGLLIPMMREAGFHSVEETRRANTALGTISFYKANEAPPRTEGSQLGPTSGRQTI